MAAWVRPLLISAAAITLVTTGAWAAWARVVPYVAGHDYFRLRTIRVSSDETRVAPQTLAEIAGLYDDASLWDVDPLAIQETLREASWVRQASVTRHFPWQVTVNVSKRHAVAAAVVDGQAFLVDHDGVLFHEVEKTAIPDLPFLTGWDQATAHAERAVRLRSLLGVLDQAESRQVDVSELHMDDDGTVWLYATGIKASVRLGDTSRATAGIERLQIALAELGPLVDRVRLIDTDYRDRIVIRGADDKLPAMMAMQADKGSAPHDAGAIDGTPTLSAPSAAPRGASTTVPSKSASSPAGKPVPHAAAAAPTQHKATRHG